MLRRAAIPKPFYYSEGMLSFFLNPLLLLGLAGIALPVVAHLLSRRKYDVVEWGAMQFLDVSRKTRRKMKLEELLLLLVRILAIALIAFALARPWFSSGFLTGYQSAGSRDVVLVIDGSNSMSRSDGISSLHEKAKRRAIAFLETLQPGDTASVIDARDRSVRVIASPLQDLESVARAISAIPDAAGAGHLREACEDAVGILGRCSNGNREIVVLTDRQRVGWEVGNAASWSRFDEVLDFPAVKPKVWVVDVSSNTADISRNIAVGRLNLSRDLTVPNFPVRFEVTIRNTGTTNVTVPVSVLVDGQRLAAMESQVEIGPKADATFSRSVQLANEGTNVITVQTNLSGDLIPADNSSSAALQVKSAIPVLLIQSSASVRGKDEAAFFAKMALTASENKSPWIQATVVNSNDLTVPMLKQAAAYVLANVDVLSDENLAGLRAEVADGKGLLVALGSRTTPAVFERVYSESGLFPTVALDRTRSAVPNSESPLTIAPYSLEAPWLTRFRERKGASFLSAEFQKWWLLTQKAATETNAATEPTAAGKIDNTVVVDSTSNDASKAALPASTGTGALQTVAILATGDPLLLQGRHGRGSLLLMTSTLDATWNRLPAVPDYVPFLHEALFQMAASRVVRNVEFSQPLQTVIPAPKGAYSESGFTNPAGSFTSVAVTNADGESKFHFPNTRLPGNYELKTSEDGEILDAFVVNYDHSEHAPESLTTQDTERLTVADRLTFVESTEALARQMYRDESRSELWGVLLWGFLGLLTFEVWMTRRMIQKGYADTNEAVGDSGFAAELS